MCIKPVTNGIIREGFHPFSGIRGRSCRFLFKLKRLTTYCLANVWGVTAIQNNMTLRGVQLTL